MAYNKYFTLSFDDGLEQDKKLIVLMKKYGIQGTFNLNAGMFGKKDWVGRIGNIAFHEFPEQGNHMLIKTNEHFRIPKDEIKQVYEGFEVASHAYFHEALPLLSPKALDKTIFDDIRELSELLDYSIVGHAYPGGASSKKVEVCLERHNILYAREAFANGSFKFPENPLRYRPTCPFMGKKTPDLLEQFIKAKADTENLLFCMWGHSYELDYGSEQASMEAIEKIFAQIAGRDDIIYCTNKEAFTLSKNQE